MSLKQTIKNAVVTTSLFGLVAVPVVSTTNTFAATCGGVATTIISCSQPGGNNKDITQSGLWGILLLVINIMTAGVAILAIAGIVYASILYVSAGGAVDQVKKARAMITNVVIGIIAYAFMYSLLNFLVPGGIFN